MNPKHARAFAFVGVVGGLALFAHAGWVAYGAPSVWPWWVSACLALIAFAASVSLRRYALEREGLQRYFDAESDRTDRWGPP